MGCAQSTAVDQGDGSFAPFSAASFATLSTKVKSGGVKKPFETILEKDKDYSSKVICEGYGINQAKPFHIGIATSNEKVSGYTTTADGAKLALGEGNQLSLVFASLLPLNAPCALYSATALDEKPWIIQGACNIVDVYLTVDGEPRRDGHICSGDGGNDTAAAIADAVNKQMPDGMEDTAKQMLEAGPPGPKPWVTLVNGQRYGQKNFQGHFVFLPLMAAKGSSVDDMIIDECASYAEGLMARFSALLADIGGGEHEFEIRFAPRSAITTGEDNINIQGPSQGSTSPDECIEKGDEGFTAFVQSKLESQITDGGIASADVPGMGAKFTLEVDGALCSGSGPARLAQPFADFADDVAEHCEIVLGIAHTGAMGTAASACLGQSPGKAVHVVLPERENHPGNIGDWGVASDEPDGGRRFIAWAFFLNPDDPDDDEAEGCMVKSWISQTTKRQYQDVDDPVWVTENIGMFPPTKFKIQNQYIRAAMERDANDPNGWAA